MRIPQSWDLTQHKLSYHRKNFYLKTHSLLFQKLQKVKIFKTSFTWLAWSLKMQMNFTILSSKNHSASLVWSPWKIWRHYTTGNQLLTTFNARLLKFSRGIKATRTQLLIQKLDSCGHSLREKNFLANTCHSIKSHTMTQLLMDSQK